MLPSTSWVTDNLSVPMWKKKGPCYLFLFLRPMAGKRESSLWKPEFPEDRSYSLFSVSAIPRTAPGMQEAPCKCTVNSDLSKKGMITCWRSCLVPSQMKCACRGGAITHEHR